MPITKSPPDDGVPSTRQMLDELDALMERMLALPVNDLDDLARAPLPRPTLSATLTVIDASESEEPAPTPTAPTLHEEPPDQPSYHSTESPEPQFSFAESSPLAPPETETEAAPDSSPGGSFAEGPRYSWNLPTAPDTSAPLIVPPPPVIAAPRRSRRSLSSWWINPLLRFNQGFDGWLERFGGLGRWLRRPTGRMVLGMAGLSMLILAIVWIVRDLANWTR